MEQSECSKKKGAEKKRGEKRGVGKKKYQREPNSLTTQLEERPIFNKCGSTGETTLGQKKGGGEQGNGL